MPRIPRKRGTCRDRSCRRDVISTEPEAQYCSIQCVGSARSGRNGRRPVKPKSRSHMLIPDCQVKPGVDISHLANAGKYIADRRPDVIVCIGDFADMPSLSSYDAGKKCFEGRRYLEDIDAAKRGMEALTAPFRDIKDYKPRMIMTLGNHEDRITRAIEDDAKLDGTIGIIDLEYERFGWEVYPFLKPVTVDGISYVHFFPRSASGAIMQTKRGAPNARAQLIREGGSCTAGHQQGLDVACLPLRGKLQWGLIAGSFYSHHESYLSPQGNAHWRGLVVKHEVKDGSYNPMFVSLEYLARRYRSPIQRA